jgi:hypothetical protein
VAGSMQVRQLADQIGFSKVFRIHTRHVDLLGDPYEAGWPGTGLMLRLVPPDWGSNAGSNTAAGHVAVLDAALRHLPDVSGSRTRSRCLTSG